MKHDITPETNKAIWAIKNFEDAVIVSVGIEDAENRFFKTYEKELRNLLTLLLGRKPTDYEMHLARDHI